MKEFSKGDRVKNNLYKFLPVGTIVDRVPAINKRANAAGLYDYVVHYDGGAVDDKYGTKSRYQTVQAECLELA